MCRRADWFIWCEYCMLKNYDRNLCLKSRFWKCFNRIFLNYRSLLCTSQKRLASAFWRPEVKWWLWINWLYVPLPAPTLCCSKAKEQPGRPTVTSELLESLVPMSSLWCDQRAGNSNVPVADVLLVDTRNRIPSHMFCPKILDNNNRYKMLRFQINFVCRFIFNPGFGV